MFLFDCMYSCTVYCTIVSFRLEKACEIEPPISKADTMTSAVKEVSEEDKAQALKLKDEGNKLFKVLTHPFANLLNPDPARYQGGDHMKAAGIYAKASKLDPTNHVLFRHNSHSFVDAAPEWAVLGHGLPRWGSALTIECTGSNLAAALLGTGHKFKQVPLSHPHFPFGPTLKKSIR